MSPILSQPTARLHLASPWGPLMALATADALCGVYFEDQDDFPDLQGIPDRSAPVLERFAQRFDHYLAGAPVIFDLPLAAGGTAFQRAVWEELARCPHGVTWTYGALAQRIGRPKAVRAVGQAVGRNPWIIVVPCHRVLAAGGTLGGFSAGLPRKRSLLALEGVQVAADPQMALLPAGAGGSCDRIGMA